MATLIIAGLLGIGHYPPPFIEAQQEITNGMLRKFHLQPLEFAGGFIKAEVIHEIKGLCGADLYAAICQDLVHVRPSVATDIGHRLCGSKMKCSSKKK
ncbi:hypothetical protein D9M69_724920 [compost metagenome]